MLQSDALAHEPRESPAIIFHGNGSVGATGRRCRYKLAASGGSAGCVRQLEAPIWLTPIAGGYETARKRPFFGEMRRGRCVGDPFILQRMAVMSDVYLSRLMVAGLGQVGALAKA